MATRIEPDDHEGLQPSLSSERGRLHVTSCRYNMGDDRRVMTDTVHDAHSAPPCQSAIEEDSLPPR